ncbi:hypothetical protein BF95_24440 [Sphingobium sp. Ant17]|nr:hypothetical protein BF95_24440 [Sphingobium sp. Ant17]
MTVKLSMTDTLVDLISAHADVAIRFGQLKDSSVLFREIGQVGMGAWWGAPSLLETWGMPK